MLCRDGDDPARVDDSRADPLRREPFGGLEGDLRHRPDSHDEHVLVRGLPQHVDPVRGAPLGVELGADTALREPDDRGRVVDRHGLRQLLPKPGGVARRGETDVGHDLQQREVPHAVVARPVGSGDAGPVEHEGDARAMEGDIHHHLVEGAVDERRVDRHDRMQPAEREAGRAGDGVLLGDADVEDALRDTSRRSDGARSVAAWPP